MAFCHHEEIHRMFPISSKSAVHSIRRHWWADHRGPRNPPPPKKKIPPPQSTRYLAEKATRVGMPRLGSGENLGFWGLEPLPWWPTSLSGRTVTESVPLVLSFSFRQQCSNTATTIWVERRRTEAGNSEPPLLSRGYLASISQAYGVPLSSG